MALIVAATLLLSGCDQGGEAGHRGRLVPGAVHLEVIPVHHICQSRFFVLHPHARRRSLIRVGFLYSNASDDTVQVSRCSAMGNDAHGRFLFRVPGVMTGGWLLPGDTIGARSPASTRWAAFSWTSLHITRAEVRAVAWYDTSCRAYRWIGPIPEPGGD